MSTHIESTHGDLVDVSIPNYLTSTDRLADGLSAVADRWRALLFGLGFAAIALFSLVNQGQTPKYYFTVYGWFALGALAWVVQGGVSAMRPTRR